MRILSAAALTGLMLSAATLPATAQEDPDLPGVRVTIQPRSFLDPGNKVQPRTTADYSTSNLNQTFTSQNYSGVEGLSRYPLPYPLDLPSNPKIYVLQAPDRIR